MTKNSSILKGKRILLGVSSGIAIYKVLDLLSRLKKLEAEVDIIMTHHATEMISPLMFQTMGRTQVHTQMFEERENYDVEHISLARRADICLLAPATANTMAKLAHGIADNLLTTTFLATTAKIMLAPTMNTEMLKNPATQANMDVLRERGFDFISSNPGFLACNEFGDGRMAEPVEIIDALEEAVTPKDLVGKRIIITAGPTLERIDPVRYIANDSSGKMGFSLALEARNRGAEVVLIHGPVKLEEPRLFKVVAVESALEMKKAIKDNFEEADALIMAAAVGDYRPQMAEGKIKKEDGQEGLVLELAENPDLLKHFSSIKGDRTMIGFAAETENLLANAEKKLLAKGCDYIVANDVSRTDIGFNSDYNQVSILSKDGIEESPLLPKREIGSIILDLLR